jgi:LmbE family N-acetylglucosaminyl deacetylase
LVVDVRDWAGRKLAALRCHRSQMGARNPIAWVDDADMRRWLGAEHFRRAPIGAAGRSVLEELAEPIGRALSDFAR